MGLKCLKVWCWSESECGSRITFPLSLALRDREFYDIF